MEFAIIIARAALVSQPLRGSFEKPLPTRTTGFDLELTGEAPAMPTPPQGRPPFVAVRPCGAIAIITRGRLYDSSSYVYRLTDFTKLGWRNVNFFILRAVSYSLAPCVAGSAKRHVLGRHFLTLQRPQSPNGDSEVPPNAESSTIGQNAVEN